MSVRNAGQELKASVCEGARATLEVVKDDARNPRRVIGSSEGERTPPILRRGRSVRGPEVKLGSRIVLAPAASGA
jgi:hypothetical protein